MSEYGYLMHLGSLINSGQYREGRNGGTYGLFGAQMRFDLSKGFPLLTTKKVNLKAVIAELIWFLSGSTNAKVLEDQGVNIWKEWGDPITRELGPVYGKQWRSFGGDWDSGHEVDQIVRLVKGLKTDPYGRRHIVTAWNPNETDDMALPPCHCLFQFFVSADNKLSCHLYQRSADWFLGVPFNIASYSLLTMIVAREVGLELGDFVHSFGDYHLYANHIDQAKLQYSRYPKLDLPQMKIIASKDKTIFDLEINDFLLTNYNPYPAIKAPVSA